ncbi:MAG: hypothetical protein QOK05_1460 [Chloroflexota bacterium]|jgi:hypothetical protein|nr:hypothetical protein [Chloroflexota bacterium]
MDEPSDLREGLIQRLLSACPALRAAWESERADDESEPLPYMQAAALAEVVVQALARDETDCFPAFFRTMEEYVANESDETELAVTGVLEDLQGSLGWADLDPLALHPWLGPASTTAWDALLAMWGDIARKKRSGELPPGPFDGGLPDVQDPKLRSILRSTIRPPERR